MKKVNNFVKTNQFPDRIRFALTECGTLAGFRTLPFKGFDILEESKKLAFAGETHSHPFGWDRVWAAANDTLFSTLPSPQVPARGRMGLRDYIASAMWVTSGASDHGRVTWQFEDRHGTFKAKKNNLIYIYTTDELYDITMTHLGKMVNRSITKEETAKIRLAIAGDLANYLAMAWIFYLLSDDWKQIPYMANTWTVPDELSFHAWVIDECRTCYGMPYDFDAYDHQVTTSETKTSFYSYASRAIGSDQFSDEVRQVIDLCMTGFDNSVIIARDGMNEVHTYPVTGGLPSGLRITSFLGNVYNAAVNLIADYHTTLQFNTPVKVISVRGDDTNIMDPSATKILFHYMMMTALGMKAGAGKFGIHKGATEFLRNWYSVNGVRGYPARPIASFTQQKTWSPEPPTFDDSLRAMLVASAAVSRRSSETVTLEPLAIQIWSHQRHLPPHVARQPPELHGPAILPWMGWYWPDLVYPTTADDVDVRLTLPNQSVFSETLTMPQGVKQPTQRERADIVRLAASTTVQNDRVPGLNAAIRRYLASTIRLGTNKQYIDDYNYYPEITHTTALQVNPVPSPHDAQRIRQRNAYALSQFQQYVKLSKSMSSVKPAKLMSRYHPEFWTRVRRLERAGLHRSTSVDVAAYQLSIPQTDVPPQLIAQISSLASATIITVATTFPFRRRNVDGARLVHVATEIATQAVVTASPLSRLLRY
jgi:hypothetical protein